MVYEGVDGSFGDEKPRLPSFLIFNGFDQTVFISKTERNGATLGVDAEAPRDASLKSSK